MYIYIYIYISLSLYIYIYIYIYTYISTDDGCHAQPTRATSTGDIAHYEYMELAKKTSVLQEATLLLCSAEYADII